MHTFLRSTPCLIAIAFFVTTELVISRAVRGKKSDDRDKGTFWLVWLTWNFALISNIALLLALPKDDPLEIVNVCGLALCGFAGFFRVVCKKTLGKFYTMTVNILDDHQLVTTGPYGVIRHPLYAGFVLFFLAWPLTQPSLMGMLYAEALGGIPVLITIMVRIHVEERALEEQFKDDWQAYVTRTRRLIPGLY